MPREPREGSFVVGAVSYDPTPSYMAWMMIDQAHAVPMRFSVTFDLTEPLFIVAIDIVMDGTRPTVARLETIPGRRDERNFIIDSGDGVTTTSLRRILVDRLVRRAVEEVRQPIERLPADAQAALVRGGAMPAEAERIAGNAFRIPGVTPPGQFQVSPPATAPERSTTSARIAEAYMLFERARANGSKAPQKDVALAMGISTSQVSRYLKAARERFDQMNRPLLSGMSPEEYERHAKGFSGEGSPDPAGKTQDR